LAICYRNTIIQAGPVTGENYTSSSGGYTQVNFAGIWKILSKRILLPTTVTWTSGSVVASDANTVLSGLTYGGVAQTLVQTQLLRGPLPITFLGSPAAGSVNATYNGYDLNLVSDILIDLTTTLGGCEIDFAPYWAVPGHNIQFRMRVSDTKLGQNGNPWPWDFGGRGALQDADYTADGSLMTSTEFVRGAGSQTTLVVGQAISNTLVSARFPLLESINGDHTSVTSVATLNGYAAANVATYQTPIITPFMYVRVDGRGTNGMRTGSPTLEQIAPGDNGQFQFQGHRRFPDGTYVYRIVEIAQGLDVGSVKLGLQPAQWTG
jgi:hypothetical protein